jgi:hypothetical protein
MNNHSLGASSPADGLNTSGTVYNPTIIYSTPESLTEDEKEVLEYLLKAWESFIALDDNNEFKDAIHRAQEKIAIECITEIREN